MIEGMEKYIGRRLNDYAINRYKDVIKDLGYLLTRPDDTGPNIHINMMIYFDDNYVITDFDGDKCYSYSRGLYNRSSNPSTRPFSKKDIAYLIRFVRIITD